jgi:hypothetical protein
MRFRGFLFACLVCFFIFTPRIFAENPRVPAVSAMSLPLSGRSLDADTELSKKTQNPAAGTIPGTGKRCMGPTLTFIFPG